MIGPRNSLLRILKGEEVTPEEYVRDKSVFINTAFMSNEDFPELWVDQVRDYVGGECDA